MRESTRANLLIVLSLTAILGSMAVYASFILSWFRKDARGPAPAPPVSAELQGARKQFRQSLLDAGSAVALSEALYRAHRPVDSFYVEYWAQSFYGPAEFTRAHDSQVLRKSAINVDVDPRDPKATLEKLEQALAAKPDDRGLLLLKARLSGPTNPVEAIGLLARVVNVEPSSFEAREALDELQRMVESKDQAQSETAADAKEALQELLQAKPDDPFVFSALAMSAWQRGDLAAARALVADTLAKKPKHAGALMVDGAVAWSQGDSDTALQRFSAAFERNPEDLYSAGKLAEVFDKQGVNREAALPYYIAVYRRRPDASDSGKPVEDTIREILDVKSLEAAGNAPPETLARYLASDDASVRAQACLRAGQLADARWLDPLFEKLDDDVELVRRNARAALVELFKRDPSALESRRETWLSDPRPLSRAGALAVLAEAGAAKTLPAVERALKDPDPAVRFFAHAVLQNRFRGSPEAVRARAEYLAAETDPLVLSRYGMPVRKAAAR